MSKLAIISSHPIQYNAPLFVLLAQQPGLTLKVFYTWSQSEKSVFDPGFGQTRSWDIPLLEGYEYEFVTNVATRPGSHHFWGLKNPSLISRVSDFQPNAILVFGWSFYSHLQLMRYFKGKTPVWFRGDSNLQDEPTGFHWKKALRRWWLSWVYQHVDKAFYVGEANRQYFLAHGLKSNQLIFAPHAVDNERFEANHEAKKMEALIWRQNLGIPDEAVVFLFVGKMETKKNPIGLINAFIKSQIPAYLLLVGEGRDKDSIFRLCQSHDKIILLGFQNQGIMPLVYQLGDILVLPSIGPGETWGLVVNEAMACGKAVLVSAKCGCASDLVHVGVNGYVFDPYHTTDLKEKLFYMTNKTQILNMGEQSKNIIGRYSFESIINAIKQNLFINI